MKTKIIKSIFITAVLVLICAMAVFSAILFLNRNIAEAIAGEEGEIVGYLMAVFILLSLLCLFLATAFARGIVAPIINIDPKRISGDDVYDEIKPIANRLSSQNYRVSKQKSELSIRQNEFDSITFYMSEGMIIINSRAQILSCNRSAKEIYDFKKEPKSILQIDDSSDFREAIGAALSGKNGYYTMKKGEKFYSVIATPVVHDSIIEGAVIVLLDVTEKEERESLRREFTSNISHELKTPLTSISGFAEIISSGIADPADVSRFAENIHKEATRLITLVGDIIRLSQLDGGEIPYDEESIDLLLMANEVKERLTNLAERAEISISVDGESAMVMGNATIIGEMIYNLCDNAIKYNRAGGFVEISVFSGDKESCISVSDNGIGIPKDKQDRVFERFYRVDKSHSKAIGGTGLGLSIVKHAAAYHKAKILFDSEEGVGTKVVLSFPRACGEE